MTYHTVKCFVIWKKSIMPQDVFHSIPIIEKMLRLPSAILMIHTLLKYTCLRYLALVSVWCYFLTLSPCFLLLCHCGLLTALNTRSIIPFQGFCSLFILPYRQLFHVSSLVHFPTSPRSQLKYSFLKQCSVE